MTRATGGALPVPAAARRLRLPLHQRSQARMRERWGFDVDAPDALARATALRDERPDDADRHVLLAAVLSSRGADGDALQSAREAVRLDASSARAHTTLATLLAGAGDRDAALDHAERAADLDPTDPVARYNHGLLLAATDRTAAGAEFESAASQLGLPPLPRWRRWFG